MTRLLGAFLIIYMLIFSVGCQAVPISKVGESATPVVFQQKNTEDADGKADSESIDKDAAKQLTLDDLQLGQLKLKTTAQEAVLAFGDLPVKIIKEQNGILEKRLYEDIELNILDGEVAYISTTSDKYPTPRGLKVGDSVEKLIELYGTPAQIYNNIYSFAISGEYYLFHAEVKDGKVIRIQVNLAC